MTIKLHDNFRFIKKRGADKCVVCGEMIKDKELCLSIKRQFHGKSSGNITIHINCIGKLSKDLTNIKQSCNYLRKKLDGLTFEYVKAGYMTVRKPNSPKCSYCNRIVGNNYAVELRRTWMIQVWIDIKCISKVVKLLRNSLKKYNDVIVANLL